MDDHQLTPLEQRLAKWVEQERGREAAAKANQRGPHWSEPRAVAEEPRRKRCRAMATDPGWWWKHAEDEPLPPPVWPEHHPLAPPPPLRLKSGFDPEAWYRRQCQLRGWEGRLPRPSEKWPQCCRCGLRFQLRHVRPEDRAGGVCFRCLARQRGWAPPLEPDRIPSGTDGRCVWPHGSAANNQDPARRKLPALAEEVVRVMGRRNLSSGNRRKAKNPGGGKPTESEQADVGTALSVLSGVAEGERS